MSRHERTGTRSLLFSGWHRTLPGYCAAIDIDFLEYCDTCGELLALFELTFARGQKATTVLERLAVQAGIDAYVIYLVEDGGQLVRAEVGMVSPRREPLEEMTEPELRRWVVELHDFHNGRPCRGAVAALKHRLRVEHRRVP